MGERCSRGPVCRLLQRGSTSRSPTLTSPSTRGASFRISFMGCSGSRILAAPRSTRSSAGSRRTPRGACARGKRPARPSGARTTARRRCARPARWRPPAPGSSRARAAGRPVRPGSHPPEGPRTNAQFADLERVAGKGGFLLPLPAKPRTFPALAPPVRLFGRTVVGLRGERWDCPPWLGNVGSRRVPFRIGGSRASVGTRPTRRLAVVRAAPVRAPTWTVRALFLLGWPDSRLGREAA